MKEQKTFTEKILVSSKNDVKLEKPGSESRKDPKEMSQPENTAEKKPSLGYNRLDGQPSPLSQALWLLLLLLFIISPPSPGRTIQLRSQDCMPVSSCISSTLNMNPAFYQNVEIRESASERESAQMLNGPKP